MPRACRVPLHTFGKHMYWALVALSCVSVAPTWLVLRPPTAAAHFGCLAIMAHALNLAPMCRDGCVGVS